MTTKMISEETLQPQAQEETRITPRDLRRVFWRSFQMEFSWNYERQMNLAFVYALIPVLKKLYPRREELAAALKRHLVFFNTTPHIVTLLLGITTAMEEKNSQQKIRMQKYLVKADGLLSMDRRNENARDRSEHAHRCGREALHRGK